MKIKRKALVCVSLFGALLAILAVGVSWRLSSDAEFWILRQGGTELVYLVDFSRIPTNRDLCLKDTRGVVKRRLTAFGLRAVAVSDQGEDQIVVRFPGTDTAAVEEVKRQLAVRGDLHLRLVVPPEGSKSLAEYEEEERVFLAADRDWVRRKVADPSLAERSPELPLYIVRPQVDRGDSADGRGELRPKLEEKLLLENSHVYMTDLGKWHSLGFIDMLHARRVAMVVDERTLKPAVTFEFAPDRAQRLLELTEKNVGRSLALVMNDWVLHVIEIRERIDGPVRLSGDMTASEMRDIVVFLRTGRLRTPSPLTFLSQRTLEPDK